MSKGTNYPTMEHTSPAAGLLKALQLQEKGYKITIKQDAPNVLRVYAGNWIVCTLLTSGDPIECLRGSADLLHTIAD